MRVYCLDHKTVRRWIIFTQTSSLLAGVSLEIAEVKQTRGALDVLNLLSTCKNFLPYPIFPHPLTHTHLHLLLTLTLTHTPPHTHTLIPSHTSTNTHIHTQESNVTQEYLQCLYDRHEQWLVNKSKYFSTALQSSG